MGRGGRLKDPSVVPLAYLLTFFDTLTVGMVNPIYPMLVQSEQLGPTLFAALQSMASFGGFVAATYFGRLSDIYGRRMAIVAACVTTFAGWILYALGFAADGFNPNARLWLPVVGRVLSGVGREALRGPVLAMISEDAAASSPGDEAAATKRVAMAMATLGLGFSVGSGIGGLLVSGEGSAWRTLNVILVCASAQLACAILVPRDAPSKSKKKGAPSDGGLRAALLSAVAARATCVLLLLQVFASGSFHVYDATSALYLQDALGYSSSERGYLLMFAGWAFAAQSFLAVPFFVKRFKGPFLLRGAYLCIFVGRFGLAAASRLPPTLTIVLSYCVLNLGQGMVHTLLKSLMSEAAGGPKRLGLMLGLLGSVEKGIGVVAPLLGGPVYTAAGPPAPAIMASLFGLCGFALTPLMS